MRSRLNAIAAQNIDSRLRASIIIIMNHNIAHLLSSLVQLRLLLLQGLRALSSLLGLLNLLCLTPAQSIQRALLSRSKHPPWLSPRSPCSWCSSGASDHC